MIISNLTGYGTGGFVNKDGSIMINPDSKDMRSEIIHEVQHVIQGIEGFARGDNAARGEREYRYSAGEVQARNVQTRMNMTAEERRQKMLSKTEDVSYKDQILLNQAMARRLGQKFFRCI